MSKARKFIKYKLFDYTSLKTQFSLFLILATGNFPNRNVLSTNINCSFRGFNCGCLYILMIDGAAIAF